MSTARSAEADLYFNGHSVKDTLKDIKQEFTYDDVASGSSDTVSLTLFNSDLRFLNGWLPKKGDRIVAKILLHHWNSEYDEKKMDCGDFLLDEMNMTGGPLIANLGGISLPTDTSIKRTNRTRTWKSTSVKGIGAAIASRYKLAFMYDGPDHAVESIEQTDRSDSDFLYELAKKYGVGMKIYKNRIVMYGKNEYEVHKPTLTLSRSSFVGDSWDWTDTIEGTYTGGRCSYKQTDNKKKNKVDREFSVYCPVTGTKGEKDPSARTLKLSEQAANLADAIHLISAGVNNENEKATILEGDIWPDVRMVSGIMVKVDGTLGKAAGNYFVEEVKTTINGSGTKMHVKMHRYQNKVDMVHYTVTETTKEPKKSTKKAAAKSKSKSYNVGDIVNFHGGTHYYTSYPGAKGYPARAGRARITVKNGSGKAHPWHLIHVDGSSNVYGWVDNGTFD